MWSRVMWAPVEKFLYHRQQLRELKAFRSEIAKNLEIFHVMRQLGLLRPFQNLLGERILAKSGTDWPTEILDYVRRINEYNLALKVSEDYQGWYAVDISRQNQANAKTLHDFQEAAQEKSEEIEILVMRAKAVVEDAIKRR